MEKWREYDLFFFVKQWALISAWTKMPEWAFSRFQSLTQILSAAVKICLQMQAQERLGIASKLDDGCLPTK